MYAYSHRMKIKSFYLSRFAKIYPVHLVTLILALPLSIGVSDLGFKIFMNLTLLKSLVPDHTIAYSLNTPSWSISDEAFFYALFPFLLIWSGSKIFYILSGLLIISIPVMMHTLTVDPHWFFHINPFVRIAEFVIGIMLFSVYKKSSIKNATVWEISVIGVVILFYLFRNYIPSVYRISAYYWIPMSALILVLAYQKGVVSKFLSRRPLVFLGEISFSFYMVHSLVIGYGLAINNRTIQSTDPYFLGMLFFILSFAASSFLYLYIEKPCYTWIKKSKVPEPSATP